MLTDGCDTENLELMCLGHENSNVHYLPSGHVFRVFSRQTWACIYLTRMLAARTSFHHLHLGPIRHYTSRFNHSFQVMAHGQTNWKPPSRLTEEPSLKVYNSLTRTKVRPFRAC